MNIRFKNDISTYYMLIDDVPDFSREDYQVKVLTNNEIKGLLDMDYEVLNGNVNLLYNISSKESFSKVYSNKKMGFTELKMFIYSLNSLIKSLKEYLLDADNVILKQECIFMDEENGRIKYCYFPYYHGDFILEMKELFAQILSVIDYSDQKAVRLAYGIQKETQKDSFTFDDIIKIAGKIASEKHGYEENNDEREENRTTDEQIFYENGQVSEIQYKEKFEKENLNDRKRKEKKKKEYNHKKIMEQGRILLKAGELFKDKKEKKTRSKPSEDVAAEDLPSEIFNISDDIAEGGISLYKRYTRQAKQ